MSVSFEDYDFSGAMRDISRGLLVKPILTNYLYDAQFPAFDLHFAKQEMERAPDDYFHPSTHPMWHERVLYQYLAAPASFPVERKKYMSTLAVMMGKVSHEFVQMCLTDAGIRPPELQACAICPPRFECHEAGVQDEVLKERGHMDGVLDFTGYPNVPDEKMQPILEFKCLAPETMVSMADGILVEAAKVSAGDMLLGWDESTVQCVPRRVERVWDNGIVPVWAVATKAGRQIGVTAEHPFLTSEGWVLAKDLAPGDKVRVGWGSEWSSDSGETEEPWFLGVMVGDGGLTSTGVNLSAADPRVVNAVRKYVEDQGASLRHISRCDYSITAGRSGRYTNPVREMLRREALLGCGSREKFVPRSVWTGGPSAWAAFLSGYFDADGTVVTTGSYPHLLWTSVNRSLLTECQTLLAYLGIRASVVTINSAYAGKPHRSYRLLVRDRRAVVRAQEVLRLRSRKAAALGEIVRPEREDGRWVRVQQQGWDEVLRVVEGLSRPTIAIEVEGGTHVTAGLVTHNTSHDEFGRLSGVPDLNAEAFKAKWPVYWAQVQRYMRLSGRPAAIVLMMEMIYPFTMREFHIAYDAGFNAQIDAKYRQVRQAVADQRPPTCCGLKGCVSSILCGVVR